MDTIISEPAMTNMDSCSQDCLVLYTNEDCLFCVQMRQLVYAALDAHRVPREILVETDISDAERNITQFPTVRLCESIITGIQPLDRLTGGLLRLLLKPCFRTRLDRYRQLL